MLVEGVPRGTVSEEGDSRIWAVETCLFSMSFLSGCSKNMREDSGRASSVAHGAAPDSRALQH